MVKKENPQDPRVKDDNPMDVVNEGLNVVVQAVNNATGLDKSNDGQPNNDKDKKGRADA
ncbi:hypothetical protein [Mesobacillus campisalis]|uniref:hypothetical protein n=1 Tax=Mesobacillus campisalis TaxID=1408103 RepID=UPI000AF8E6E8|nr:hypothetical protein [Mesobacillus campisalis]